jgi:hypothetical protein
MDFLKGHSYSLDLVQNVIIITSPVQQHITGRAGIFDVTLLEVKDMTLSEFRSYSNCVDTSFVCSSYDERESRFWKSLG